MSEAMEMLCWRMDKLEKALRDMKDLLKAFEGMKIGEDGNGVERAVDKAKNRHVKL